jgi:hypothetical protein
LTEDSGRFYAKKTRKTFRGANAPTPEFVHSLKSLDSGGILGYYFSGLDTFQIRNYTFRRILTALGAAFAAVAFVLSVFFVLGHAEHECAHDDGCPVCMQIRACEDLFERLSSGAGVARGASAAPIFAVFIVWAFCALLLVAPTLSNLKIRLNN